MNILNMIDRRVRSHLTQDRNPTRQHIDIAHLEIDTSLLSHCQQVQHGVRRTAHRNIHRHGIQEGLARSDRTRQNRIVILEIVLAGIFYDQTGCLMEQLLTICMGSHKGSVAGQRKAERLGQTVHRIRRKHTRARSASGTGRMFQTSQIFIGEVLVCSLDHYIDQVVRTITHPAGLHRTARYEYRRNVQAHGCHQHPRSDLIAVRDADHRIDLVRIAHILNAVGDQIPRRQGIEHSVVSHSDTVIDSDRVELGCETPLFGDPLFDLLSNLVQMYVSRHKLCKRIDNSDHRLSELFVFHSVGSPQASRSCHPTSRRTDTASEIFHDSICF